MSISDYIDCNKYKAIKQVKNYKLYDYLIGKGASGEVYISHDIQNDQVVAMKVIKSSKLNEEKCLSAFQREIKALNDLRHPNIIKIISVEKTVNNIYMSLEYCNSGTLGRLKNYFIEKYSTGIPEGLVQRILIQLSEGLNYMHLKRVMHRDLKLENVLIHFPSTYYRKTIEEYEKTGFAGMQIKIADLGYARDISESDTASTFCGTPLNIAPDLIIREKDKGYNFKADMWSLGALAYEMLVGVPPFLDKGIKEVIQKIKEGKYQYPKNCVISVEAVTFINGLLSFDPEKRFEASQLKKHPFLANDPSTFNPLKIDAIPPDQLKNGNIEVNSKDNNNFLWAMYKTEGIKEIKDVETKDLEDEKVMQSICVIPQERSEKRDILGRFRKGKEQYKSSQKEEDFQNINSDNTIKKDNAKNPEEKQNENIIIEEKKNDEVMKQEIEKPIEENVEKDSPKKDNIEKENIVDDKKEENIKKEDQIKQIEDIKDDEEDKLQENNNDENQDQAEIEVDWNSYSFVDDKIEVSKFYDYEINNEYIA